MPRISRIGERIDCPPCAGRGCNGREATARLSNQLESPAKEQRHNVGRRLDALELDLSRDLKKLTAKTHEYRLRVGTLRVLFTLEKDLSAFTL